MSQLCLCRVKANKATCDAGACVEDIDELRWVRKFDLLSHSCRPSSAANRTLSVDDIAMSKLIDENRTNKTYRGKISW
jgi:hypothetical protein